MAIGDDVTHLRELERPHLALYIGGMGARGANYYNDLACAYGYADAARTIQDLYLAGDKDAAAAAVPAELLAGTTLIGPPSYVRERLAAYRAAGVTIYNASPVGPDPWHDAEAPRARRRLRRPAVGVMPRDALGWRTVATVLTGTLLNPLNSSMISVALLSAASDLHVDLATATWLISSFYLVGATVSARPAGGRPRRPRRVFRAGCSPSWSPACWRRSLRPSPGCWCGGSVRRVGAPPRSIRPARRFSVCRLAVRVRRRRRSAQSRSPTVPAPRSDR